MHLVAIGWLYVALMMAVAEATSSDGTVIGAVLTFVLYGVLPVWLVLYLLAEPARRRRRRERDAAELARRRAESAAPDGGSEAAAAAAVAPVREEP